MDVERARDCGRLTTGVHFKPPPGAGSGETAIFLVQNFPHQSYAFDAGGQVSFL